MGAKGSSRGAWSRVVVGLSIVAASGWTGGCSSTKPSAPATFCDAYEKAVANWKFNCQGGSLAALTTAIAALDPCRFVNTEISSGSVAFDPDAAAACLDEIPVLACWQFGSFGPDCAKVFTGTIPEGGACYLGTALLADECAPGNRCLANVQCPGICTRYSQLGESCTVETDGSSGCAPGLTCAGDVPVCTTAAVWSTAVGMPCWSLDDCTGDDGTLACEGPGGPIDDFAPPPGDGGTAPGTCQPPRDDGPCSFATECRSDVCFGAQGGTPTTDGVCLAPKVTGDSCTPGLGECGLGTYCGAASTCVVLPSIGQSCVGNAGEGQACIDGACDPGSMICVPFGKQGDTCEAATCGLAFTCDSATRTCLPNCIRGSACGSPGQSCCAEQLCNGGAACVNGICTS